MLAQYELYTVCIANVDTFKTHTIQHTLVNMHLYTKTHNMHGYALYAHIHILTQYGYALANEHMYTNSHNMDMRYQKSTISTCTQTHTQYGYAISNEHNHTNRTMQ